MNAKKLIALSFACVMLLSAAACNRKDDGSSLIQNPSLADAGQSQNEGSSEPQVEVDNRKREISDDNVHIQLDIDREEYTAEDLITLNITITNTGDELIAFTKGSGSNRVPDALHVSIGELSRLYMPDMMTMDYQLERLEPGKSVTYELPFAPYVANADDLPPIGFDRDISYFQTEDYTAAQAGDIQGTIRFTYVLAGRGGEGRMDGEYEADADGRVEGDDTADGDGIVGDVVSSVENGVDELTDGVMDLFNEPGGDHDIVLEETFTIRIA